MEAKLFGRTKINTSRHSCRAVLDHQHHCEGRSVLTFDSPLHKSRVDKNEVCQTIFVGQRYGNKGAGRTSSKSIGDRINSAGYDQQLIEDANVNETHE